MPDPPGQIRKELDKEDENPDFTDLPPREVEDIIMRDRREKFIKIHGGDSSDPPPPPPPPQDPA